MEHPKFYIIDQTTNVKTEISAEDYHNIKEQNDISFGTISNGNSTLNTPRSTFSPCPSASSSFHNLSRSTLSLSNCNLSGTTSTQNTTLTPTSSSIQKTSLKQYAQLVLQKVKEKRTTDYNEVADELVLEYSGKKSADQTIVGDETPSKIAKCERSSGENKNIRRRVYDALNVLMAINIIYKDKRQIHYLGLPDFDDLMKVIKNPSDPVKLTNNHREEYANNQSNSTISESAKDQGGAESSDASTCTSGNNGVHNETATSVIETGNQQSSSLRESLPSSNGTETTNNSGIVYSIPNSEIEQITLNNKITKLQESIKKKRRTVQEQILQQLANKSLTARNKKIEEEQRKLDNENLMILAENSLKESLCDISSNSCSVWANLNNELLEENLDSNHNEIQVDVNQHFGFEANLNNFVNGVGSELEIPVAVRELNFQNAGTDNRRKAYHNPLLSDNLLLVLSDDEDFQYQSTRANKRLKSTDTFTSLISGSTQRSKSPDKLNLPFIVAKTDSTGTVNCDFTSDEKEYIFDFHQAIKLVDDTEILQELGLTFNFHIPTGDREDDNSGFGFRKRNCFPSLKDLEEAKKLLPKNSRPYLDQLYEELQLEREGNSYNSCQ